jgi:hypothetical protein
MTPLSAVRHGFGALKTPALVDQQLAGIVMWISMGTVYMVSALACLARALRGPLRLHAGHAAQQPRPAAGSGE